MIRLRPPARRDAEADGGRSRITEEAEQAVAAYFGFDECLFLPSGYQGNLACAMALIHAGQPVFVDRRVHASIARGLVLGKADVRTYAHADYGHLERRLASAPPATVQPLVMTESLFSMDGTELDVSRMAELRSKYGFFLMVDEAHAVGALGPGGRGLCLHVGFVALSGQNAENASLVDDGNGIKDALVFQKGNAAFPGRGSLEARQAAEIMRGSIGADALPLYIAQNKLRKTKHLCSLL